MYRVLCDGTPIYDLRDEDLVLIDPKLELEVNKAGSFSFKIPPQHPQYDLPQKMTSCIQVYQDDEEVFNGRITESSIDFYNRKQFTCEGQLAYLNDSIQRPAEYHDMTVRGYLETLIAKHNAQVEADKQFTVGIVTVTDNNDSLYRYTNYNSTMQEIKEDLVDDLGGYLRVRNVDGVAYLDYIAEYDNTSSQKIEFGENLLDYTRDTDVTDIGTVFIPLGAKLEESPIEALEQRLTIESVNDGSDSLVNEEAVEKFGRITKVVTWDNVTTADILLSKAQKYISDYQWDTLALEVKAIDMHWTDSDIAQFKLGDKVMVHSSVHGLERYFPLTKISIQLNNLSNSRFTLGTETNTKLTSRSQSISDAAAKAIATIPLRSSLMAEAKKQADALIQAATHGYVVTTANEVLIMDTNDVNTATKVWRWNLNGLGYSNNGYAGPYATAITMDGQILGALLAAGSVTTEKISAAYTESVEKSYTDAIELSKEGILLEVSENYATGEQVNSQIEQKADSIRLKADKIAWSSTNSSLTEDGVLTCEGANINGNITVGGESDTYGEIIIKDSSGETAATINSDGIMYNKGDSWVPYFHASEHYKVTVTKFDGGGNSVCYADLSFMVPQDIGSSDLLKYLNVYGIDKCGVSVSIREITSPQNKGSTALCSLGTIGFRNIEYVRDGMGTGTLTLTVECSYVAYWLNTGDSRYCPPDSLTLNIDFVY